MEEKISMLKSLMELANIDGKMVEREFSFLWAIANQLGITDKAVFDAIMIADIDFVPPENEYERILQFQRMVLMMNVDEKTTPAELTYVREMGMKMGLNTMAVSTVLREMKNYPNHMMPPDDLIAIFRRHHN